MDGLFGVVEREDLGPARHVEATFSYLKRSTRPHYVLNRRILEGWWSRYPYGCADPRKAREDLVAKLCNEDNDNSHYGGFLELLLHELFWRLGCEPFVQERPDFLISPKARAAYVEAKYAAELSDDEMTAKIRGGKVLDRISTELQAEPFWLRFEGDGYPRKEVRLRRVVHELKEHLATLNVDEVAAAWDRGRWRALRKAFVFEGWRIRVLPYPKEKERFPALFSHGFGARWTDPRGDLFRAVHGKMPSRYGDLIHPYVVAVHVQAWGCGDREAASALFGRTTIGGRCNDGIWAPGRNSRIAAVLVLSHIYDCDVRDSYVRLVLNPWVEGEPYSGPLLQLPHVVWNPETKDLNTRPGRSLADVLAVPAEWPPDPEPDDEGEQG